MSKILCISHIFPPSIDGGSRVIYKLGQYFEKQGNQVLYLSSDCSSTDDFVKTNTKVPRLVKEGDRGRLKIPVYHSLRRPLKFINLFIPKSFYLHQLFEIYQKGPIFRFFPFLKAIYQILKFKPNLIIAGPLPTTIILYANFLRNLINIFYKIVSFPSLHQGRGLRGGFCRLLINASFHPTDPDFHRLPLIQTLQKSDYLWTLTQYETNYFTKNFHINPNKIILAGNGIDKSFLIKKAKKIKHQNFNILFIGSFAAHKNISTLIQSFSNLPSNTSLTIAGQKTLYYPQIKKQITKLPYKGKSRIRFTFNFPQSKLSQLIDNCDCLILPSQQESFGLVLIEAWARQKPIIVSDIPPLKELIKRTHGGLVFKLNNPLNLSQKITKLSKNPQLAHQLGQNGFKYVKNNYTWDEVGNRIKEKLSLS